MNPYSEILSYLYDLQRRGVKLGLSTIKRLLQSVGNPERKFPSIHIAGTNGKGSTAAFLASCFQEAGYRTGLYTSPHLVRFTERMRVNGREIPQAKVMQLAERLRSSIERYHATFFESTTALAFSHFAQEEVEIGIIETGLGGRLDATNVLSPLVSVVTNVSLEHRDWLGDSIEAIAREKGGIIKAGIPVVTAAESSEALACLSAIAGQCGAPFYRSQDLISIVEPDTTARTQGFEFLTPGSRMKNVKLGLEGPHQRTNAQLAMATLEVLLKRRSVAGRFSRITERSIRAAFRNVKRNTGLAGRLQRVGRGSSLLLDVAHNPDGMRMLVRALGPRQGDGFTVVFGAMKDKDYSAMLSELAPITGILIAVAPSAERALPPETIQREAERLGIRSAKASSVAMGVSRARRRGRALVTGSHYVVGEALTYLKRKRA